MFYGKISKITLKLQYYKQGLKIFKASKNISLWEIRKRKKHTEKWFVVQNEVHDVHVYK